MVCSTIVTLSASRRRRQSAFTLVEIMIVVVIIGLLAAMAIAAFQRVRERTRISRFANDLRIFAQVFETYTLEHGGWPPDAAPGQIPVGMEGSLPAAWTQPSIVGGVWEWDGEATIKSITAYQPTESDAFMLKIDALIDDGVATSGRFRKNGSEWNYLLETTP